VELPYEIAAPDQPEVGTGEPLRDLFVRGTNVAADEADLSIRTVGSSR
jgi:hypothetical protein